MIRNIVRVLVLVPLALIIAMFAVANRAPVLIGFDPFVNLVDYLEARLNEGERGERGERGEASERGKRAGRAASAPYASSALYAQPARATETLP